MSTRLGLATSEKHQGRLIIRVPGCGSMVTATRCQGKESLWNLEGSWHAHGDQSVPISRHEVNQVPLHLGLLTLLTQLFNEEGLPIPRHFRPNPWSAHLMHQKKGKEETHWIMVKNGLGEEHGILCLDTPDGKMWSGTIPGKIVGDQERPTMDTAPEEVMTNLTIQLLTQWITPTIVSSARTRRATTVASR